MLLETSFLYNWKYSNLCNQAVPFWENSTFLFGFDLDFQFFYPVHFCELWNYNSELKLDCGDLYFSVFSNVSAMLQSREKDLFLLLEEKCRGKNLNAYSCCRD